MTEPTKTGKLLIVGTPIGNLGLPPRGRRPCRGDGRLCEDTRVTGKLAARSSLRPGAFPADPREESRVGELLERLRAADRGDRDRRGMPTSDRARGW
jgi:16S rRNA C1402 (ribose-2'-O) methylase RsmI